MTTKKVIFSLFLFVVMGLTTSAYSQTFARIGNDGGLGGVKDPVYDDIRPPIGPRHLPELGRLAQFDQSPRLLRALGDESLLYKELHIASEINFEKMVKEFRTKNTGPSRVVLTNQNEIMGLLHFFKESDEIKFIPPNEFELVEDNPFVIESIINEKVRSLSEQSYL